MIQYTYPKPINFNRDQLLNEVWEQVDETPMTYEYDDTSVIFGFVEPLKNPQENLLEQIIIDHVADPDWREKREPWHSITFTSQVLWATIHEFNIPNKQVVVRRIIGGQTFTKSCAITWAVQRAFLAGEIAVGDKVLVTFVDGDITKPIIIDKIVL